MYLISSYILLYKRHKWMLILGIMLTTVTLLASICLASLSGWFLSSSAIIGSTGIYSFNYMLPAVSIRMAAIIRTVGRYFERLVSHDATFRIMQYLRVNIFAKLLPLSPAGLMHCRQGDLLNRIVSDVDTINNLYLRVLSPLISSFVIILVVIFTMIYLDNVLTLILGSITSLTLCILSSIFYRIGKPIGDNITRLRDEYRHQLTIWLHNQTELIVFGANERYRMQMNNVESNWCKAQYYQYKLVAFSQALMMLISGITVFMIIWVAADGLKNELQSSTAIIPLFVFCTLAIFEALVPASGAFYHYGQIISSAALINKIIKREPEVSFTNEYLETPSQVMLRLDRVSFSYVGQLQNALEDITFSVDPGMRVAIIGHIGCGKSTLLQLLTRAWDPQHGVISINNIPITNFSEESLRRTISVVPQRVHLFNATLRDNLLLFPSKVEDEMLFSVLQQVGLNRLMNHINLDDWLGEGGRQLSGGELRRLAIARALLHNAPLMLLDEPTEDLDATTETQIFELLLKTTYSKTLLMATHKLNRLRKFDKIILLDNGRIIDEK